MLSDEERLRQAAKRVLEHDDATYAEPPDVNGSFEVFDREDDSRACARAVLGGIPGGAKWWVVAIVLLAVGLTFGFMFGLAFR